MQRKIEQTIRRLRQSPKRWLVTGVAGFIGSNLLEYLLANHQIVIGLDNFATGFQSNLDAVNSHENFYFIEGDILSLKTCQQACEGVDYVLHQAALGSIPRSIHNPIATNATNITGFLNMLVAARDAKVQSFTYAASSSTYGDNATLPKREEIIGKPLSPYAITKYVNELYADVFSEVYGFKTIGLRYFNVFGPRQNRHGAYAAVIPTWMTAMVRDEEIYINGDGESSRDFCFIDNVIEANILAATAEEAAKNKVYNIALNDRTSLNQLFVYLQQSLAKRAIYYKREPIYRAPRPGDMRHSQADISKAKLGLGYDPIFKIQAGIDKAMPWYIQHGSIESVA